MTTNAFFVKGRHHGLECFVPMFETLSVISVGWIAWDDGKLQEVIKQISGDAKITDAFGKMNGRGRRANNAAAEAAAAWEEYRIQNPGTFANLGDLIIDPVKVVNEQGRIVQKEITHNKNLLKKVKKGDFIIVPRAREGRFLVAKVNDEFQVFALDRNVWEQEEWKNERAKLFDSSHGPSHLAQVFSRRAEDRSLDKCILEAIDLEAQLAQGWRTEAIKSVPLYCLPPPLRKCMRAQGSRGQIGLQALDKNSLTAIFQQLNDFIDGDTLSINPQWHSTKELLRAILHLASFETLCVELLQLRDSAGGKRWLHVGSPGDQGADGIAIGADGRIVGILQCKYESYFTTPQKLAEACFEDFEFDALPESTELIVATLLHPDGLRGSDPSEPIQVKVAGRCVEVWDSDYIGKLAEVHSQGLPLLCGWAGVRNRD